MKGILSLSVDLSFRSWISNFKLFILRIIEKDRKISNVLFESVSSFLLSAEEYIFH